jgi:hypothetical protein
MLRILLHRCALIHARALDVHRAHTGHDCPLGSVAVANNRLTVFLGADIVMPFEVLLDFRYQGLLKQLPGSFLRCLPNDLIDRFDGWRIGL